jgi:AraC-like DNA-binding protein
MSSQVLVRASQLNVLHLQFVQIQPEFLNGFLTVTEWLRLEALQRQSNCISLFKANDGTGQQFARLAEQMGNVSLPIRCALLQLWVSHTASLIAGDAPDLARENSLLERFRKLLGALPEIELFKYSLSELAGQLGCSERHFSRLFRREFGVPFHGHQIELRLQHACQLLTDPNKKILSIAYDCGYRNMGLFNEMFKRRFGMTPTEWRRFNSIPSFQKAPQPSIRINTETQPYSTRQATETKSIRINGCGLAGKNGAFH